MDNNHPSLPQLLVKAIVVHTVIYVLMGIPAFVLGYGARVYADSRIVGMFRPSDHVLVMAGPLLQVIRGGVLGLALYPLREILFWRPRGWLVMWGLFAGLGILSASGPSPGSIEGLVYTVFPLSYHLAGLPQAAVEALAVSLVLCYWVKHPGRSWLAWVLGILFLLVLALSLRATLIHWP